MARTSDLEGQRDMGGKHGGQAGMPDPENRSSAQQGIVRDERGQEQPADEARAQHVRNSDSPFRRCAIYIGHRPPSAAATEVLHLPAQSPTRPPRLTALN